MRMRSTLPLVLSFVSLGCAAVTPTPEQERVYRQADECTKATGYPMNVTYVSPDGRRIRIGEGANAGAHAAWKACMTQRFGYRW